MCRWAWYVGQRLSRVILHVGTSSSIVGRMFDQSHGNEIRTKGHHGLAIYLSLWLAFAYLWLALFYPLMCAPYRAHTYPPIDRISTFEHTTTPFSMVMSVPVALPLYIASDAASTSAWLLDAHSDATGLALTFINVLSLPALSWLHGVQPLRTTTLLHVEFYQQVRIAPPEKPPRLLPFALIV